MLHRRHDGVGQSATIERIHSVRGQRLVGLGKVWVAEDRTHRRGIAIGQVELPGRGEVLEAIPVGDDLVVECLVDLEATPSDPDGRSERFRQRNRSKPSQRLLPEPRGPRHAHAQPAGHSLGERDRLPGRRIDEAVGPERGRRSLAPVQREHAAVTRAVDDHETTAAHTAGERFHDSKDGRRGHRGVYGVAAPAQNVDGSFGGHWVDAGRGATAADGTRLLGRCRARRENRLGRDPDRSHHGQKRKHRTPHGTPHRTSPPSHIATFEWRLSHDEPTSASRDCQRGNLGSPTKKQPRSPPKSELTGSASVVCVNQVEKPFKTGRGRRPS